MVDGDFGTVDNTFSAGSDDTAPYRDTHLDADKALNCAIALAYFVKAFAALTDTERDAWFAVYGPAYRFELGSLLLSWGAGGDLTFYAAMDVASMDVEDAGVVLKALNDSLTDTEFGSPESGHNDAYTMVLSEPLAELQRAAREDAGKTDEDRFMLELLQAIRNNPRFAA